MSKDGSRQWVIEAIDRARLKLRFHVWAYVVMPEHVHLLVWPTEPLYDISEFLNSAKQSVAKRAVGHVKRTAPAFLARMEDRQPDGRTTYRFWQRGGGYDRNVIEPASVFRQIEYIHNNPVRRQLCETPADWLWSSAADYAGLRQGPLLIDRESLPTLTEFEM